MLRIVKTKLGTVEGIPAADPRITAFKSVPFAKPPVGKLRFAPPQPAEPWEGVRQCYKFPPIPVQPSPNRNPPPEDVYSREWSVDPDIPVSEDCLYLNIWTPAKTGKEKLPVYFWIFGGGWQVGHTAEMEFDGERIARRGIVVVTVNYRVNLFGFTCHPELTKEYPKAPANMGLQDQQAGMKWVYENIEAFGGDKNNITIGGQSAGAGSVMFHIANKESRKYFKRAMVESGLLYTPGFEMFPKRSLAESEKIGEEFFKFCGCKNLAEARKLTTEQLRQKWSEWGGFGRSVECWTPTYDQNFHKGQLYDLVKEGKCTPCPIMTGFTTDEFIRDGISPVEFGIRKLMKEEEAKGLKLQNYCYKFDVPIPGWDHAGKFHSVDLWFFFETLAKCWRPFSGIHYDVARQMCDYLCNFIKTGNPNGLDLNGNPLPKWDAFTSRKSNFMEFTTGSAQNSIPVSKEMKKYL